LLSELLQSLFYLACDTLATGVDTIVREAAGVTLHHKDLDLVF
jgi:hypothetical protein